MIFVMEQAATRFLLTLPFQTTIELTHMMPESWRIYDYLRDLATTWPSGELFVPSATKAD